MTCVSKGAPNHPKEQDEKQKGMQELWNFLRDHNAVFLGDPELKDELESFLKKNKVKRGRTTDKQKKYNDLIAKTVEALP